MLVNIGLKSDKTASDETVLVAIGDVHGRADLLKRLLKRLNRKLGDRPHRTIFLGDYVDRGKDSRGVLDLLIEYREQHPQSVFLRGNHEQVMLDFLENPVAAEVWLDWGGEETLESYGVDVPYPADPEELSRALAEAMPQSHHEFLNSLPLRHEEGRYLFVHAGVNPERALDDQKERDMLWIRESFLTAPGESFGDRVIVHGHTPVDEAENLPWRINMDSGAVWTGRLSAVLLQGDNRDFVTS